MAFSSNDEYNIDAKTCIYYTLYTLAHVYMIWN